MWFAAVEQEKLLLSPARMAEGLTADDFDPFRRYPHIDLIDQAIVDAVEGKGPNRLIITMPPRHGKSFLVSQWTPAWFLLKYPRRKVLLASYEADFAREWGRKARALVEEYGARFGVEVDSKSSAADRWDLVGFTGGMRTAGAGGPITGKGGHLVIVDDPIKNSDDADSEVLRERLWEWWFSTLMTRLEKGAVVVLVQTRWHSDDLAGRVLANDAAKGAWRLVNLPAIAEEPDDALGRAIGDPLCPELIPLEQLEEQRLGSARTWAALYQQRPMTLGGGIFREESLRYFDTRDDGRLVLDHQGRKEVVDLTECYRFATVDTAFTRNKRSDWTVCAHWAVTPERKLILTDLDRVQVEGAEHLPLLKRAWAHNPKPAWIGVEKITASMTLIEMARREGILVRELRPDRSKQSRAEAAATMCGQGDVFLPRTAPWLDVFVSELLGFDTAAHDDCVDVLAYAANEVARGTVRGRSAPVDEPVSDEARIREQLTRMFRRRKAHPVLGSF